MKKNSKVVSKQRFAPRQQRSRAMVEYILDAAARILRTQGIAGFTTNRIAELAGVGIASLYQYFPNKQAVLEAVVQRHLNDIETILLSKECTDTLSRLDALIDGAVAAHACDPLLHRAITMIPDFPGRYNKISQAKRKLDGDIQLLLNDYLAKLAPDVASERLKVSALVLHSMVETAVHRAVTDMSGEYDIAQVGTELKRAARLYVESLTF